MTEDYSKLPVTQMVTRRIQELILSGEFAPNSRLPSQRVLAERFGVSRASLREALLTLETLGLIRTLPARGTFVGSADARAVSPGLTWRYDGQLPMEDVFQTRILIESEMCRLAAARMDADMLTQITSAAQRFEAGWRSGDLLAHVDADLAFHSLIADACPNTLLRAVYHSIHAALTESQRVPIPNTAVARMEASIAEHGAILDALRDRDPAAAGAAMRRHIENTARIAGVDLTLSPR